MPISVAANLQPRNATSPDPALRGTYYIVEDIYLKGGFQIRPSLADRDSINPLNRKAGMLVRTQDTGTIWQLADDLVSWEELQLGGGSGSSLKRQTKTYETGEIASRAQAKFYLELGASVLLHSLSVSVPMTVEAFETPDYTDTNPYVFIPTDSHLSDDGSTLLANGEIVFNRRYTILTNQESPKLDNIYFRITNNSDIASSTTLTIQYLTLEGA